jgi:hypothetical protein
MLLAALDRFEGGFASSGLELGEEGAGDLEVGGAVEGLVEDVEVFLAEADAAQAVGAARHVGAADEVARAGAVAGVGAVLARGEAARCLAVRRVAAVDALDAVVAADEALRMPAEGALRAAATGLALDAAIVVDARLECAEQLAVARFELVQGELGDGTRGAAPERIDERGLGGADARGTRARHDLTLPACSLRPRWARGRAVLLGTRRLRTQRLRTRRVAPENPARTFGATPLDVA